jgi:hypothetical protein
MLPTSVYSSLTCSVQNELVKAPRGAFWSRCWIFSISTLIVLASITPTAVTAAQANLHPEHWIGTWATAPQSAMPGSIDIFQNQTLRLIVHASAGGKKVRIKMSNTYGDQPLQIGGTHIARRTVGAEIDSASDRKLLFQGEASISVPVHSQVLSDPVEVDSGDHLHVNDAGYIATGNAVPLSLFERH